MFEGPFVGHMCQDLNWRVDGRNALSDISHELKKCRFDGRLECTLRKKRVHHLTSLRFQSTSMSGWWISHISHVNVQTNIDFLESTYFHSETYCIILDWIISCWNLLYIYIISYRYTYIYINIYSSINLYPISYPPKMSFELRHVASAILARSSMASTFTSVTTHDPRRDPATHRSLPWPRRTEKPHSVLQEFDGDTIPQLPKK